MDNFVRRAILTHAVLLIQDDVMQGTQEKSVLAFYEPNPSI